MMIKLTMIAATILLSTSALAGTYEYEDSKYKINITGKSISSEHCEKKECDTAKADVDELKEQLKLRVDESTKLLSDEGDLIKKALKIATDKDAQIIKDPTTETEYVMITIGEGFNLPVNMEDVKKEDLGIVVTAMKANKDRYSRVLSVLDSGKLPADVATDKYDVISPIAEMHNVVKFAKYL
jgi:hypothetical protein